MAMKEIDVLGDAIAATEKEIFGEAWGKEEIVQDETGDRSREAMGEGLEGQHEPDDDNEPETEEVEGEESEQGEGEPEPGKKEGETETEEVLKTKAETDEPAPKGRVPSARLREQTERTKAAETERDTLKTQLETERANSRKEIDALNARLDGILAAIQRGQPTAQTSQDQPKVDSRPDLFENPQGFVTHLEQGLDSKLGQVLQRLDAQRVETSMQIAAGIHKDAFKNAFEAVSKLDPRNPDDQMTVRRIYASPNPGEALVQWHKRNETLREVGEDPAAYKERIAKETREALMKDPQFRKQLLGDLRAEASTGAEGGRPRTEVRLPKSLNGAAGGNTARDTADPLMYDDSDSAVFQSAWR